MVNLKKATKKGSSKNADFQKIKHRVGKLKPGAINKTSTTVKSQKLHLRHQAMSRSQKVEEYGAFNNSFEDDHEETLKALLAPLWSLCRHHNHLQRRDAYKSIEREVGKALPDEILTVYVDLINQIGKGLMDRQSAVVRRAVSDLLFALIPHTSLLRGMSHELFLNYLLMAMTHIDSDVKKDTSSLFARLLSKENQKFLFLITKDLNGCISKRIILALRTTGSTESFLLFSKLIQDTYDELSKTKKNNTQMSFTINQSTIPLTLLQRSKDEFSTEIRVQQMKIDSFKEEKDVLDWIVRATLLEEWRRCSGASTNKANTESTLAARRGDIETFFKVIMSISDTTESVSKILK